MREQMERPRPVPSSLVVKNGSKTRSSSPSGIGGPSFPTRTVTISLSPCRDAPAAKGKKGAKPKKGAKGKAAAAEESEAEEKPVAEEEFTRPGEPGGRQFTIRDTRG